MTCRGNPSRDRVIVTAEVLRDELAGPTAPVVLDVRWALGDPDGHAHHLAAHLPAAVYVDLDTELAGPVGPGTGRHPLPTPAALQDSARRWGVSSGDRVVVHDATGGTAAARAWWLLRWGGLDEVRLLDGGLAGWVAAGGPLETGPVPAPEPGDVKLPGHRMPVLDADAAAVSARDGLLLDARAGARYRGEVEPVDPRAGHVPGAVSAPTTENLGGDGTFLPPDALSARFDALGLAGSMPVGVYCGSGVTAAHEIAALASIGVDASLYAGSWSAWSADPDRPIATGPGPGGRP